MTASHTTAVGWTQVGQLGSRCRRTWGNMGLNSEITATTPRLRKAWSPWLGLPEVRRFRSLISRGAPERARLAAWLSSKGFARLSVALVVIFLAAQLAAGPGQMHFDSYYYGRTAQRFLGATPEVAHSMSINMLCADIAVQAERSRRLDPLRLAQGGPAQDVYQRCLKNLSPEVAALDPRYDAIFDSRPGYPLVASVFARVMDMRHSLWAASLLSTILSAGLVWLILRRLAAPPLAPLLGSALFLTLPAGAWSLELLSEGAALTGTLAVVLGSVLLLQRRIPGGLTVCLTGYVFLFAVKNSQCLLLAGLETLGVVALGTLVKTQRHRGLGWLAGVSAGAAAVAAGGAAALGWPGAAESLQDTFTGHFKTPDVSDPWARLASLNATYWHGWVGDQAAHPLLVVSLAASLWVLWRWQLPSFFVVVAAGATGVASAVSQPIATQADRLLAPVWLIVVLGLPLALHGVEVLRAVGQRSGVVGAGATRAP